MQTVAFGRIADPASQPSLARVDAHKAGFLPWTMFEISFRERAV